MIQDNYVNPRKLLIQLNRLIFIAPILVLVGWQFNIVYLKSIFLHSVAMNPLTAVLFIISGAALYLVQQQNSSRQITLGKYIGLGILIIAVIKLVGFIKGFDIGIDQIFFNGSLAGNSMAPNTVVCFVLTSISLFLIDHKKNSRFNSAQLLAFLALILSLLALIGYLYSSMSFYRFSGYIPMAVHTAITFVVLTMGILFTRYRSGFMSIVMHKNTGGTLVRRLLPIAVAVPVITSWLRLEGQKINLYNPELGSPLGSVTIITAFSLIIWWIARSLNKTDQKRKEAELSLIKAKDNLAENELKYRNLIENSGVVIYTTSVNGIISFSSKKAFQLTGYTVNELLGMHFTKLIHDDCMDQVKNSYKNQLKNNIEETVIEFCLRTKNGTKKWIEQSAMLIVENNSIVGFQCLVKDVSQRKEMEETVRKFEVTLVQNQDRLQSILDNATSLIYIKDIDGKYILTNKHFKEALNVTEEMVMGKTDFDFAEPRQAQRFKDTDDEVIKTGKPVELEETLQMADGLHNLMIIKFPLIDAQNKIYGISGIATDITERVKQREQIMQAKQIAEDAKKLQEQFLANMSHEIRTPMNGIKGMTDLLLETTLNDEQKDFAKTIKRSSDNLLIIINDILDFSKIQAGKITIENIDFNIREVLDNIKAIFRHKVAEKNLALNININEDVPAILNGDPYRLNQILVNLAGNAIKFTHNGIIDINVSIQKNTAKKFILNFLVKDTGIGIETNKINEIFESFTQASVDTSRKYGGTGLGLAITKQLLEMQHGSISVQSEINKGTTFQFCIPYGYNKTNTPVLLAGKDVKNYQTLFTGKRFLVAEDNEVNQKVIRHVLQKAGGTVDIANNGLEALSLLKKSTAYHLIIMDLQMPQMDGYAATKYIRNVLNLSLPIIAMTASALKGEKSKCIDLGMNDYLSKPFDFSFLYKRVSQLLNDNPVNEVEVNDIEIQGKKLYDLSLLAEMDDRDYMCDILSIFISNTPGELTELKNACKVLDFDKVYKSAHKLKSSAGLLKADYLLNTLIKLEELAKAKIAEDLISLSSQAIDDYKKIETPLNEQLINMQSILSIAV